MKQSLYIVFLFLGVGSYAQTALYNSGNIRIHENGQIGFHTHLINNAAFDQNLGLAGFYGSTAISVSGAFMPIFYDIEIANDDAVLLNVPLSTINNTNFVVGNFVTPRDQRNVYYNFLQDAFFTGEDNASKIDGYATINNKQVFSFPVGDAQQLRPLILNSEAVNQLAKCAYFFEDPNFPSTFDTSFNTERRPRTIGFISRSEFWRLEGSVPSTITISWNERSNMAALTDDAVNITIVGWNKSGNRWVELGNTAIGGDVSQGFVTSESFVPDDYEIVTFGTTAVPTELLTLDNYLITPNGDGLNDELIIPEMELSPNNSIRIFDRFGLQVFGKTNYTNEFNGVSNMDNLVINREQGLPAGVYFYLVTLYDLDLDFQGFLYIAR